MGVPKSTALKQSSPLRTLLKNFSGSREGSVAIEFSMLTIPFAMLIFAIIETCVSFTAQQVIANATDNYARDIRTNIIKKENVNIAALKAKICNNISFLVTAGCPGLSVDLKTYGSFADVPTTIPLLSTGALNKSGFAAFSGDGQVIHSLRVFYEWPVMTDFIAAYTSTLPDKKILLFASSTWKNEPF